MTTRTLNDQPMNHHPTGETPRLKNASEHLLAAADLAAAGRFDEAENSFAAAILQDPGLHIARFQLGLLEWTAGRTGIALVTWLPLTLQPLPDGLDRFAQAFFALATSDTARAAQDILAGLEQCANGPLAADMKRLLESFANPATATEQSESGHVLLANYRSNVAH